MLSISKPIIVEGKYDREKILSFARATVITTDGFGIFKKSEKAALIRRLAGNTGVIILTDSDGAGLVIRNYIKSILPPSQITDIYIPQICGKEKRKTQASKEGFLGVEGTDEALLISVLSPFSDDGYSPSSYVTKTDFFLLGLSGGNESCEKRQKLASLLKLPKNLSCSSLIAAINLLVPQSEYDSAIKKIIPEGQNG